MDAQVLAGLNSLNQSIMNASQIASSHGDSKRAREMHEQDIATQNQWRAEDKEFAQFSNRQAYEWTKEFMNMDYEHQKEFIEMAQRYNSPVEQVRMMREAGLNPALAFGNSSSIGVASAGQHSAPSPSTPSALGVPSQSGYFRAPNLGDPAQSFAAIASAYQAIAQSKKSDVETSVLENSADALVRKITAEAEFAEIGSTMEREFARGDRSRSQQLADQKIAETVISIKNLAKQGDLLDAETAIKRVEKLIKDNELDRGNVELHYLPEQLRATIRGIRAAASRDSAQARLTSSQNEELQKMMEYNVGIRRNQYQMSQADVMKQGAVLYDEIDYLLGHYENLSERERAELEEVRAAADAAKWKYDMRWVDWSLNTIERINNGVTNWIPFAPDKTIVTDSDSSFDSNTRTNRRGDVLFHDDKTHRTENTRVYERRKSWHR